jgi:hypothetical protein
MQSHTWQINHSSPLSLVKFINHCMPKMLVNFPYNQKFSDLTCRIPAASIPRGPPRRNTKCKHPVAMFPRSCAANPRKCTRPFLQERQEKPSQASRCPQDSFWSQCGQNSHTLLKKIRVSSCFVFRVGEIQCLHCYELKVELQYETCELRFMGQHRKMCAECACES